MKIKIHDVTLISVSNKVSETIGSMMLSLEQAEFDSVKFLTHKKIIDWPKEIEYKEIPEIDSYIKYNDFVFRELGSYVDTPFALVVQDDSWILNGNLWDNQFLQFDYIGAPWPVRENSFMANNGDRVRVGNGGFSLRSSKLMNLPKILGLPLTQEQGFAHEDGNCCVYYRKEFLEQGIKYAPVELAARFSFENYVRENMQLKGFFGFHKNFPWR
jgi:hypothetical protein